LKNIFLIIVLISAVLSTNIKYEFLDALRVLEDKNMSNDKAAIIKLTKLSNTNKNAAFLLGYYYKTKKFNNIDIKLSSSYYLKAAKLGDIDAMLIVGWNYYKGIGFEYNMKKAKLWLEKSAISGDKEAQKLLSFIF